MKAGRGLAVAAALLAFGCASTPEPDPVYRPTQNLLEVVAVLRRHVPDDTYRFPPARDFTERNVYRSSLLRLENLERVHADALRAGQMDGVIAFAKGRALERIRAYGECLVRAARASISPGEVLRRSHSVGSDTSTVALAIVVSVWFVSSTATTAMLSRRSTRRSTTSPLMNVSVGLRFPPCFRDT